MNAPVVLAVLLMGGPCAAAQQVEHPEAQGDQSASDEMVVLGQRALFRLRLQMWDAEKHAYEVFNRFNDEERFNISCSMHQPTGTRIRRQVCQPRFEADAMRAHARDYYANLRDLFDPDTPDNASPRQHQPAEFVIASQREDYRRKMRQVAENHPEFLEALVRYSETRDRYEEATRTGGARD